MVCFDLRFPELAIALRQQGADILTAPSAFTHITGQLHWELLLRARALDSQCLTLGAAQHGWHCDGTRQTWGHAMVTDASGRVVAQVTESGHALIIVSHDHQEQQCIRTNMPLMQSRQNIAGAFHHAAGLECS